MRFAALVLVLCLTAGLSVCTLSFSAGGGECIAALDVCSKHSPAHSSDVPVIVDACCFVYGPVLVDRLAPLEDSPVSGPCLSPIDRPPAA